MCGPDWTTVLVFFIRDGGVKVDGVVTAAGPAGGERHTGDSTGWKIPIRRKVFVFQRPYSNLLKNVDGNISTFNSQFFLVPMSQGTNNWLF